MIAMPWARWATMPPPALLAPLGFRLRPFVRHPAAAAQDYQAVVAYQGAMASIDPKEHAMLRPSVVSLVASWFVITSLCAADPATRYKVYDLGNVSPTALNDAGAIIGDDPFGPHGVRLSAALPPQDLGILSAVGLNQQGVIAGTAHNGQAVILSPTTGLRLLPGGYATPTPEVAGRAINGAETVAGLGTGRVPGTPTAFVSRPIVWIADHPMDLGTLGGAGGLAFALNESGDIVGESQPTGSPAYHATLWPVAGGIVDLHRVPGARASFANAINEQGIVVGVVDGRAFWWSQASGMQLLPLLPGDAFSRAVGVNEHGQVVGQAQRADLPLAPPPHPMLWEGQDAVDLRTKIDDAQWTLVRAAGINNHGWIVGTGVKQGAGPVIGDVNRAFLLVPIPSPVPQPSVELVVQVRGDFNADGFEDVMGLALDSRIFRCLAGASACTELPGRAVGLVAGDFDGDQRTDVAAVAADSSLWVMLDGVTWQRLPGYLRSLVSGDFTGIGHAQLAGVGDDTSLWLSPTLGTWTQLPGALRTLVAGKLTGGPLDSLAGLGVDTSIWANPNTQGWTRLPGNLVTMSVVNNHLTGMSADGRRWMAPRLGDWVEIP